MYHPPGYSIAVSSNLSAKFRETLHMSNTEKTLGNEIVLVADCISVLRYKVVCY